MSRAWTWPGLILGTGIRGLVGAGDQASVLIVGPPRSGKTTSLVIPNVVWAPGAVVTTSTKDDVLAGTVTARSARGACWWYDPSASVPAPCGTKTLRWSPLAGCEKWATAVTRAHAIAGAARPWGSLSEATHWIERAEALLAPLFHAAALLDLDLSWVLRWVLRHDLTEPMGVLAERGGELPGDVLLGIAQTEERERSGILSTAAGVLAAYRNPDALAATADPNFDPVAFAASTDTLYICAPAVTQEQHAPLVVALLDAIRDATYRRGRVWPPIVWALDEVANIAPLPALPAIASEGAGQGLLTLACVQDLSQARSRWGAAADGLLSLFSAKVFLAGIGDLRTLQLVSALAGEGDVVVTSRSRTRGWGLRLGGRGATRTTSTVQRPRLPVEAAARGWPGHALAIRGPESPRWVGLLPPAATVRVESRGETPPVRGRMHRLLSLLGRSP